MEAGCPKVGDNQGRGRKMLSMMWQGAEELGETNPNPLNGDNFIVIRALLAPPTTHLSFE